MINNKILGLMGLATRAGKICFGTDSTIDMIEKNKIKLIIVANDSSDRTKRRFIDLCEKYKINIIIFETIENISRAIGKENKAVVGIKDQNIAREIVKIYDGGEVIG